MPEINHYYESQLFKIVYQFYYDLIPAVDFHYRVKEDRELDYKYCVAKWTINPKKS